MISAVCLCRRLEIENWNWKKGFMVYCWQKHSKLFAVVFKRIKI